MFGKGKIKVALDRSHFEPGDLIKGRITIDLKKPVQARGISISMIGQERSTSTSVGMGKGVSSSSSQRKIYDFKQELDGEKEYLSGQEYDFEIKIPDDILNLTPQMPELPGVAGDALKLVETAATLTGRSRRVRIKWYLQAKLDVPGGTDIRKKTDIIIG